MKIFSVMMISYVTGNYPGGPRKKLILCAARFYDAKRTLRNSDEGILDLLRQLGTVTKYSYSVKTD